MYTERRVLINDDGTWGDWITVKVTNKEKHTEFLNYFNSFYGIEEGIYPMRTVSLTEINKAIKEIKKTDQFDGDSLDRERARDLIFTEEEIFRGYHKQND